MLDHIRMWRCRWLGIPKLALLPAQRAHTQFQIACNLPDLSAVAGQPLNRLTLISAVNSRSCLSVINFSCRGQAISSPSTFFGQVHSMTPIPIGLNRSPSPIQKPPRNVRGLVTARKARRIIAVSFEKVASHVN
jgi:hypothetical protein